eukprot:TRINITY_DN68008_c0_g1_i1.p1 TRINITY_DN68008_c0_g1~~TRINITY_DN68008_c0_g1_i1.p1  ORF type:complete len:413 (+),score=69.39 TRINITY_DN68008_c0_g1_i1:151-1389(+)
MINETRDDETLDRPGASPLKKQKSPLVSVIIPCYNGAQWLDACLASVVAQTWRPLELSLYDDASTDGSGALVRGWLPRLQEAGVAVVLGGGPVDTKTAVVSSTSAKDAGTGNEDAAGKAASDEVVNAQGVVLPRGCGPAKNAAVKQSHGEYLCFLDADDEMSFDRVAAQLSVSASHEESCNVLVGSNVVRDPPEAMARFTKWANELCDEKQLLLQRFRECPLFMVTWFMHRNVFDSVGGFSEVGTGTPEDLMFFYAHCSRGGRLAKVPRPLVVYRVHEQMTSISSVPAAAIWEVRMGHIQEQLLNGLTMFSIWSAGRDGKRFYNSLNEVNRNKVRAFLDVDVKKIGSGGYFDKARKKHVPILPFTSLRDASGALQIELLPTILLVKGGLYTEFEANLADMKLEEGRDYWHFA